MNEALGALKYCLSWSPQWKRWSGITPFPSVFTFKKENPEFVSPGVALILKKFILASSF